MKTPLAEQIEYLCPGEEHPISRAMHLARLAEFFPACRGCEHRDDTGCLSAKLVKRLHEVWGDGRMPAGLRDEGFFGSTPNDLPPGLVQRVAAAFGFSFFELRKNAAFAERKATIAIAHDSRSIMPEYVAAVCEGLRFAACEVYEIGPATSAAMEFAVKHFKLDGGILLGSANLRPAAICLKFWGPGPVRMQGKNVFQSLEEILKSGFDRPERKFGSQHRLQAEEPYLASVADQFHGLRPLSFVVDSTSRPWVLQLEKLLQPTACRIIPCRVLPDEFSKQITEDGAHFGVRVWNDGECCTFFDEKGRQIESVPCSQALPGNTPSWRLCLPENGTTSESSVDLPSSRFEAEPLQQYVPRQSLGTRISDPPDAMMAVILLLNLLSRDDRSCSAALDEGAFEK